MSAQSNRTAQGGVIDRTRLLDFRFDGKSYQGHPGDTLASALLANGVRMVGRSFKYHRPRGILSAGCEEPNALVTLGAGGRIEPNVRATVAELHDGMIARSQNAWPSLGFDLGAINGLLAPFLPSGFYYKTFIGGPKGAWTRFNEPIIRRMAGLGPAPVDADPDLYDKRHARCDVLVVGAGPAGLAAAETASAAGSRVILIDEQVLPGGALRGMAEQVDGVDGMAWARDVGRALGGRDNCQVLMRTTAFGRYDHGMVMAVERLADHDPSRAGPRQRLWQIRADRIVIATGAHEQPLLFGDNDLPGAMLAQAGAVYARHYGVRVGQRVLVAAHGGDVADALSAAGAEIAAVLGEGETLRRAIGRRGVRGAEIVTVAGQTHRVDCDAILMSGGWQPAVHLHCHAGGRTRYDNALGCFVPDGVVPGVVSVGACAGSFALADCLAQGRAAGRDAADVPERTMHHAPPPSASKGPLPPHSFVDFQNDVTAADIDLAVREGYVSVEHLKRYTTTGMATDQGKLSNLSALSRLGAHLGIAPGAVGTTTFRPPYTPVTFGALAGLDIGDFIDPIRTTPMHGWHVAHGAAFENVGQWKRPWYYPAAGETMDDAVRRECAAVRSSVGMLDASTLGKIDIRGPEAAEFLNLVYTNAWAKLGIGRCRYGLMLGDDGMVMDDGVTTRTGPDRFLMTTTTGNAAKVMDHLEDLLQTEWPHLGVHLTSVTDHWAATVVTGPRARDVLAAIVSDVDLANEAFPHLAMREARIGEIPVRLYRISFTGELSYEVHVSAEHGDAIWRAIHAAGQRHGITPYGTEAMHVLRAEKGYIIIGQETDGTVTPIDLGLGWAIGKAKPDFLGKRSLARVDALRADRKQLVGLVPVDGKQMLEEGAQLTQAPGGRVPVAMLGHVTSSYWSVTCNGPIALALLKGGHDRHGDIVHARFGDHDVACTVSAPIFYDPAGERMNG
jgi:sarcosine oxidase subunit alpha